ncbi:hypothetical protein QL128_06185 [Xenorhabdus griffiniae]|uniref:hypothetical protein n=1 Tax=Xenorhabdus griffiniae TaxID=351672 RepID=UPI0024AE0740|nr:hypothetical protein [Xenorhabdus griffiniae]WMV73606.1 hypothetical protein QL128_06185 [Xenorhabdus griffiniae]
MLSRDAATNNSADFFASCQWHCRFKIVAVQCDTGSFTGWVAKRGHYLAIAFLDGLQLLDNVILRQVGHVIKQETISAGLNFRVTGFFVKSGAELQGSNEDNHQAKQPVQVASKDKSTKKPLEKRTNLIAVKMKQARHFFEMEGIADIKRKVSLGWLSGHYLKSLFLVCHKFLFPCGAFVLGNSILPHHEPGMEKPGNYLLSEVSMNALKQQQHQYRLSSKSFHTKSGDGFIFPIVLCSVAYFFLFLIR